jgi:hypothetical protein
LAWYDAPEMESRQQDNSWAGKTWYVSVDLAGKRIAVLSDNDGLAQAIKVSLGGCLNLEIVRDVLSPPVPRKNEFKNGKFDLILVAASLPTSEPVVMLARASLAQKIGQVPLLIVSDRPFDAGESTRFFHLGFPVNANRLCDKVKEILQRQSSPRFRWREKEGDKIIDDLPQVE